MLAGIPGPGFLIFRAGRVIEVPRTPLEAIAVATGISRKYLRISQNIISEYLYPEYISVLRMMYSFAE